MLTLFHSPQSRSTRVLWVLEESGLPYRIEYVTITRMDGSGGPDVRNPHPDKKVPALVHEGALITESIAIVQYISDLAPASGLAPPMGTALRGPFLTWLAYYAGVIEPVVNMEFAGLGDNQQMLRTFRGRAEMNQRLVHAFKASPYLLGERFSSADILVASLGQWMRHLLPPDKVVDEYVARCSARPALQRAMAKDQG